MRRTPESPAARTLCQGLTGQSSPRARMGQDGGRGGVGGGGGNSSRWALTAHLLYQNKAPSTPFRELCGAESSAVFGTAVPSQGASIWGK